MAAYMEHLRGGDDINYVGPFEPTMSRSTLILWECPQEPIVDDEGNETSWVPMYNSAASVVTALAGGNLRFRAAIGLTFDEWGGTWTSVTPGTEYGPMLVRSLSVEEHPNKPFTWVIKVEESSMGNLTDNGAIDGNGQGDVAMSVNVSARTRQMNAWRIGASLLPKDMLAYPYFLFDPYQMCDPDVQDMGGDSIDYKGQPQQIPIEQNVITVEFIARSPYRLWNGEYKQNGEVNYYENARALGNAVGTRNAEALFGYRQGYLLLADVALQPLHHEFKRVVLTFVADVYKHCEQRPWATEDGVVATREFCGSDATLVNLQATAVWWTQPFLQAFTMGENPDAYFPTGGWDKLWAKFGEDSGTYEAAAASGGVPNESFGNEEKETDTGGGEGEDGEEGEDNP